MRSLPQKLFFVVLMCQLGVVGLSVWLWFDWHNTLATNGHWEVSKRQVAKSVMEAEQFYFGRQALATHALNLGSWQGFQEVVSTEIADFSRITIKFRLDPGAYLYLLFSKTPEKSLGLRLSTSQLLRNAWVTIDRTGRFTTQAELPALKLMSNQDNQLDLYMDANHTEVAALLNGAYIGHYQVADIGEGAIAFRGGWLPAYIDSVTMVDKAGKVVIAESFDNQSSWLQSTVKIWLILLGLQLMAFALWRPTKAKAVLASKNMFLMAVSMIGLVSSLGMVERYFIPRYPTVEGWLSSLGKQEKQYVETAGLEITDQLLQKYTPEKQPGVYRLMFLGTSQTWGSGSQAEGEDFVSVFGHLANEKLGRPGRRYEVIPGAVSGSPASDIVELYLAQWRKLKPDLLVVNLGSNDTISPQFEAAINRLITVTTTDRTPLVFVLEANAVEYRADLENHAVIRRLAKENDLPVIDAHSYLRDNYQNGIMWWDFVHPTSYGHRLLAEYLFSQLENRLRR